MVIIERPSLSDVWQRRWQALDHRLHQTERRLRQNVGDAHTSDVLLPLLSRLIVFATGQYRFFEDGFTTRRFHNLVELSDYPLDYVFRGIINQSFNDLQVIEWAADQRLNGSDAMRAALHAADQLAYAALEPAIAGKLLNDTAVITYFEKFASIRILPYANAALIGIPFSCIHTPQDFLAIPHEAGHYVFGRGKLPEGNLRKLLFAAYGAGDPHPDEVRDWIEEIAADVYGCLIAGPVIALDFQDLQLEKSPKKFALDDGEHPAPVLRPLIYHKALHRQSRAGKGQAWAEALDAVWAYRRRQFQGHQNATAQDPAIQNPAAQEAFQPATTLSKMWPHDVISPGVGLSASHPVDRIVAAILDHLAPVMAYQRKENWWQPFRDLPLPQVAAGVTEAEMSDERLAAIVQAIYEPFQNRLDSDKRQAYLPTSQLPTVEALDWVEITANMDRRMPAWPAPFFEVAPPARRQAEKQDQWWVDVWIAQGWNTYGNGQWIQ